MRVLVGTQVVACSILLAAPASGVVGPWHENPHSKVRLVTPYATAPRQGPIQLAVEFELAPGWHAYWRNSGDAGFPPVFDAAATPELDGVRTQFPMPHRFTMPGDLESFGYAEQVTYPLEASIAAAPEAASLALRVRTDYLVCEVECVPYRYDLMLEQPLGPATVEDPATAAHVAAWRARVPRPVAAGEGRETWVSAERDGEDWFLTVHLGDGQPAGDAFFDIHPVFDLDHAAGPRFRLTRRDATLRAPVASEFAWVVAAFDARQTVEFTGAERRGGRFRWPRWPIMAAIVVLALALLIVVLGRKIP